ncbi:MAG TPA: polysaccharide biosynthesis/export family protein [Terriglobia bacterium]|jgi:polysaccharide export outer membrane protein|nr:polysaccharide biosynthesis/export family protein [Terriglobia bacterium]
MRKMKTATIGVTTLALWFVGASALPAQDAATPPPQSSGAAASSPNAGSAPSGAANQQILNAVQGYGKQLKFAVLPVPNDHYTVRGGDYINVNFTIASQFNESVPVRPDGYIALIGAPEIYVMGKTVDEVNEDVRDAYAGILSEKPLLTVAVRNFQNPYFMVSGQVARPGKYFLHGDTTLAQSIAIAGGFIGATAKDSEALLLRRVSQDYVQAKVIDLKYIDKGQVYDDMHLQSGDMVFIPKNRLSKVQPFISYFLVYSVFNISFVGSNAGLVGH